MNRLGLNKAGKAIMAMVVCALVAIIVATGIFRWKGLNDLPAKSEHDEGYYFFYEK